MVSREYSVGGHSGTGRRSYHCWMLPAYSLFPGMSVVLPLVKKIVCIFSIDPSVLRWDHMPWELSSSALKGALSQSSWANLDVSVGTMAMPLLPVGQSMGMVLRKIHFLWTDTRYVLIHVTGICQHQSSHITAAASQTWGCLNSWIFLPLTGHNVVGLQSPDLTQITNSINLVSFCQ